jgi:hypothetical protein
VYFGEMEDGSTTTQKGRGIKIWIMIRKYMLDTMRIISWMDRQDLFMIMETWYQGEFKDSQGNGKGVYYYANGDKREGHWKNGQIHGDAIYYFKDGRKYREKWDDGKELESVLIE